MTNRKHLLFSLVFVLPIIVRAAVGPSLTDMGPYETPSRHASGTITYNLGPTGARGWVRAYEGGKLFWGENGKEILVTFVEPGSPADGVLQMFDVIVGAGEKTFDKDARVCLGEAIFAAEKANGKLRLKRWRDGKVSDVVLTLPRLDKDAAVVPLQPEHAKVIRERALAYLAENMHPDGFKMYPSYRDFNTLFLLAHGRPEHLDHVRRNIREIVDRDRAGQYGPWAWITGMDAILLSEYFQATGDAHVLPALENLCRWMENARSYAGGWGHGGPYGGYGHVGLPGMFNAIGLVLARECGITGYDRVINDARKLYARGAGLGKMGYGGFDAGMGLQTIYGDNGKSGTASVLSDVLDDRVNTRAFSTVACAMSPYNESGHTGHFWSYSWGALGSAKAPQPYRKFHAETTAWYYTLARTWRGGLTAQPWMVSMGSYAPGGAIENTGGMALWYCMPMRSLRILGGEKTVFAQNLQGPLEAARQKFYDKDYDGCLALLNRLKKADENKRWADQLAAKVAQARKTIALTKEAIASDIEHGDIYVAERRLNALKPILGNIHEVDAIEQRLATDKVKEIWKAGETYYDAMQWQACKDYERFHRAPSIVFDPKKRDAMQALAAKDDYYGTMATAALKQWPAEPTEQPDELVKKNMEIAQGSRLFISKAPDAENGVTYAYYEFDEPPQNADELKKLTPVAQGVATNFDLSPRKRKKNFGFTFRTFLDVPEDGEVTFTTTSDDASFLYIDGQLVVDNGGKHGMVAKHGTVLLKKGRRELDCVYIQRDGGFGLALDVNNLAGKPPKQKLDEDFTLDDPSKFKKLRLKVKASGAVAVYLNNEVICRFGKKRRKRIFDHAWKEWESVTLKPVALKLLKTGPNTLSVETTIKPLAPGKATIGVELQGL